MVRMTAASKRNRPDVDFIEANLGRSQLVEAGQKLGDSSYSPKTSRRASHISPMVA